eukprot:365196-Chlamydomonas_euryale.AAC.6
MGSQQRQPAEADAGAANGSGSASSSRCRCRRGGCGRLRQPATRTCQVSSDSCALASRPFDLHATAHMSFRQWFRWPFATWPLHTRPPCQTAPTVGPFARWPLHDWPLHTSKPCSPASLHTLLARKPPHLARPQTSKPGSPASLSEDMPACDPAGIASFGPWAPMRATYDATYVRHFHVRHL